METAEIITTAQLLAEYQRIMTREAKFNPDCRYWIENAERAQDMAIENTTMSIIHEDIVLGEHSEYLGDILYRLSKKDDPESKQMAESWTQIFFDEIKEANYHNCATETAVIVMATLMANGEWYDWREKAYL